MQMLVAASWPLVATTVCHHNTSAHRSCSFNGHSTTVHARRVLHRKERMYFLGDSVARQIAGRMVCEHDRAFQPNLTAFDRDRDCAKFSLNDKLKKTCNKAAGRGACELRMPGRNEQDEVAMTAAFMWFQWLAQPPATIPLTISTNSHKISIQNVDACTGYLVKGSSVTACLRDFLGDSTSSDVLVIRGGLQYLLYGGEYVKVACKGHAGCGVIPWEDELRKGLHAGIQMLTAHFKGKIIWWNLTPIAERDVSEVCEPPLKNVGENITAARSIVREVVGSHPEITLIDPISKCKAEPPPGKGDSYFGTACEGYADCVHFLDPLQGLTISAILHAIEKRGARRERRHLRAPVKDRPRDIAAQGKHNHKAGATHRPAPQSLLG